jgi:hypothetical protein
MLRPSILSLCVMCLSMPSHAADEASRLPLDRPQAMRDVEAVCTGIGTEARQDPRWNAYPLRVEVAGAGGQLLGEVTLTVTRENQPLLSVRCTGPWLLVRLPPGAVRVTAEFEGRMVAANANVPATGQGRVTLRFPQQGGTVSPEYVPPGTR